MTFLWPSMLFMLLLILPVILLYIGVQKRRQVLGSVFGHADQAATARQNPGWRRHFVPGLFLLSLAILLAALARPQAKITLPRVEGTVMLVMDVSGSMAAEDIEPNRLEAAKNAAREFILSQPETVQIGVISFSGSGFAVQTPTEDEQQLLDAINRLGPQSGTSLGQGILAALNTIAADAGLEPPVQSTPEDSAPRQNQAQPVMTVDDNLLAQLPEGPYPSSVIVLFSDGENNQSINPLTAAQAAAERGVRIDALGFGTTAGTTLEVDGFNIHTALDENALQQITSAAGGSYFNTQNEQDPQKVYTNLSPQLVVKPETMEVTSLFAAGSMLVMLIGAAFSMLWFNRLP
jgi:Ca-activated chloride channel family protein